MAGNVSNWIVLSQAAALTNGFIKSNNVTSIIYSNPSSFQPAGTYLVPANTNGFVDAGITNGLLRTNNLTSIIYSNPAAFQPAGTYLVPANTNGFITLDNVPADNVAWQSNAVDAVARATNSAQDVQLNSAAQRQGYPDTTNFSLVAGAGCSLAGQVATLSLSGRVTLVASEPFSSFDFQDNSGIIGANLEVEYAYGTGWTNELIYPCYTGSVYYTAGGIDGSAARTLSNWVVRGYGYATNLGMTNDLRGTMVSVDQPTTSDNAVPKSYVDSSVGAITPANWAQYPATDTIRINGHMLLAGGWSLTQTAGVGIVSYGDVWATSNQMVLAHNGNPIIRLASGYTGLTITNFSISGGIAKIWVATNGVVTTPQIQTTISLMDPQWSPVTFR